MYYRNLLLFALLLLSTCPANPQNRALSAIAKGGNSEQSGTGLAPHGSSVEEGGKSPLKPLTTTAVTPPARSIGANSGPTSANTTADQAETRQTPTPAEQPTYPTVPAVVQPARPPVQAVPTYTTPSVPASSTVPGQPVVPGMTPPAVVPPAVSQVLAQTYAVFKAAPSAQTFADFIHAFKTLLSDPASVKVPAATIIRSNPALHDIGIKVFDTGHGRVWTFPKVHQTRDLIVQWVEVTPHMAIVGRGRRMRKVTTYTSTWKMQSLTLPPSVVLKDARVLLAGAMPESGRHLILVGEERGSSLWLRAYKAMEGGWRESIDPFESVPAWLRNNVSGKIGFRGADLMFMVARLVNGNNSESETGIMSLPEADSSTYKFWLRLTDQGYVLDTRLPDESAFYIVNQFIQAVQQNRTDVAKSLLIDQKLLSIPKYVGLKGQTGAFRVVEMATPWAGIARFRLITGGRNDLIFDIGKAKDRQVIKSIFIAQTDPFLQEIARNLPLADKIVPPEPVSTTKPEDQAAPAQKH